MNIEDYYPQGKRWWVRLHEKGGKLYEAPAHHHKLEEFLDAYLEAATLWDVKKAPSSARPWGGRKSSPRSG